MSKRRRSDLMWGPEGQWVVLEFQDGYADRHPTGHVDEKLAALDLACWRKYGTLSANSQAWVAAATRMANSTRQRRQRGASLTRLDIMRLLQQQGYACAVSGRGFILNDQPSAPWQPSIDRIDNEQGYTPDNVRIVCLIVNVAMHRWGEEPLRELAGLLA